MNKLQKKVGPLPLWGWGAAIALGIALYYYRTHGTTAPMVAGAAASATPQLTPTEGAFDFPSGLSSGGAGPEAMGNPLTAQDIADALSADLIPVLATLPYASAPGEPSDGGAGDPVGQTLTIIKQLQDSGLIPKVAPPSSTGGQTSKPIAHTKPTHVSERVNRSKGNPRSGQTYRVLVNPHGHAKGTYHVYGKGKAAKYIRVKK